MAPWLGADLPNSATWYVDVVHGNNDNQYTFISRVYLAGGDVDHKVAWFTLARLSLNIRRDHQPHHYLIAMQTIRILIHNPIDLCKTPTSAEDTDSGVWRLAAATHQSWALAQIHDVPEPRYTQIQIEQNKTTPIYC